jgi:CubicO group peptidase (beta-lactamase class C family)
MKRLLDLVLLLAFAASVSAQTYFPAKGEWQHRKPSEVGMDDAQVEEAIAFARTQETARPKDLSDQARIFGRLLGPMPKERGGINGVVIRNGFIVAEFGETSRVDPTYSVAKSYLSTILGLTIDRGMIRSVDDLVGETVRDGGYDTPHNAKVRWKHHANQTSEWEGVMFGKPDTFLGVAEFGEGRREPRERREPGTYYEYNDVRINRMSLSLLRLWKRPLPEVLKTAIMDPIGASSTWVYHGYDNSDVEVAGVTMKSVSGGTRWGGGLWMSTLDHARFGYLVLRNGRWNDRQLVSASWVREATMPKPPAPDYGYLWWLNTEGKHWPDVPRSSFAAVGAGSNTIWIDPEHDLVVVLRWHQGSGNELFKRLVAAVRSPA